MHSERDLAGGKICPFQCIILALRCLSNSSYFGSALYWLYRLSRSVGNSLCVRKKMRLWAIAEEEKS